MHIPQDMLTGPICPVTAAVAGITLAASACLAYKHRIDSIIEAKVASMDSKTASDANSSEVSGEGFRKSVYKAIMKGALKFIGVTAIVFVLQALNFPIWDGISGHFIGGVLAAVILGAPGGIICMATVLVIQAFVLGDGGVDALGANIINMGIIGAGVGGLIRKALNDFGLNNLVSTGIAAFLGLILAVLALDVELIICHKGSMEVFQHLMFAHLILAFIEAFITVGLYVLLTRDVRQPSMRFSVATACIVVLISTILLKFPGKSELPDGLEWTAEECNLMVNDTNKNENKTEEPVQTETIQNL